MHNVQQSLHFWDHFLTLNQPRTRKCLQSFHKSIRIYMGVIIVGANTLYIKFCLFNKIPMVSKGLI